MPVTPLCVEVPSLLRTVLVSDMPDTAWAATQTKPPASICIDVSNINTIGVTYKAYTSAGANVNPSGIISAACIDVSDTLVQGGVASETLIGTTPLDVAVHAGDRLTYDVSKCRLVTIRVASQALGGTVAYIKIFTDVIN